MLANEMFLNLVNNGEARVGREFYPYLHVGVALLLALEHLLANRFFRKEERA